MIFNLLRSPWTPCHLTLTAVSQPFKAQWVDSATWGSKFIKVFPLINCRFFSHHCISFLCVFASSAICCLRFVWYWRSASNTAMVVEERWPGTCVTSLMENDFSSKILGHWEIILSNVLSGKWYNLPPEIYFHT